MGKPRAGVTGTAAVALFAALASTAEADNMRGDDQPKDKPGQAWHDGGHESHGEDWQQSWSDAYRAPPVVPVVPDYVPPPVVYAPPPVFVEPDMADGNR